MDGPFAGMAGDRRNFGSQDFATGAVGFDGVSPRPQRDAGLVADGGPGGGARGPAAHDLGGPWRQPFQLDFLTRRVERAQLLEADLAHQRMAPMDTPLRAQRWEMRNTMTTGTVAMTEPANRGPHAVVCAPMKSASPIGKVKC